MTTKLVKIENPELEDSLAELEAAAKIIRGGGLVVMPTETVYGLGGNATDSAAATKIYAAKGRPSDNPLIIHIANPEDAEKYCFTSPMYYALAKAFMPGPLTVILPKKDSVPSSVTGGLDTVAVRCPAHPVAHALIEKCGVPIAAPSANLSGKPSPTTARHVMDDMDGRVDMVIDGGECEIGLESTIIKLDENRAILLRPGAITYDALCMVCDKVDIAPTVIEKLAENERPLCPGIKYRHYSPTTPVVLLEGSSDNILNFLQSEQRARPNKCIILCYDEEKAALDEAKLIPVGAEKDLSTQAKRLFIALRDADKLGGEVIYAHLPPKTGLGLALYNRLIRAAAHTVKKV